MYVCIFVCMYIVCMYALADSDGMLFLLCIQVFVETIRKNAFSTFSTNADLSIDVHSVERWDHVERDLPATMKLTTIHKNGSSSSDPSVSVPAPLLESFAN
jgi:hypothetical protein